MDWRDLRVALAVERHGTLAAAAASLALDPTTVSRRITALEEALGAPLFRRGGDGWAPTDAGRRVVEHAARMALEVQALRHEVDDAVARVEGTVRLTLLDDLAVWWLAPHVAALRVRHPDLVLHVLCTEKVMDLGRGRADIALRLNRPEEAGMRVRRLGVVPIGLYAAPGYLRRMPVPALPWDGAVDLVSLGSEGNPSPELRWVRGLLPNVRVACATNSVPAAHAMIREGVGLGVLGVQPAEADGLVRLDVGVPGLARPLWRVVPESLAAAPRIKAVLEWLEGIGGPRDDRGPPDASA